MDCASAVWSHTLTDLLLQESTSFFSRKKKMTMPPKKITGIIDGMKQVYFSKVQGWWRSSLCTHTAVVFVRDCHG